MPHVFAIAPQKAKDADRWTEGEGQATDAVHSLTDCPDSLKLLSQSNTRTRGRLNKMGTDNTVRDNKREQRFEMALGEGKTAFIRYAETGEGMVELTHTEVPEEFEGKGIGSKLVRGTFEILREENLQMMPLCPFITAYLQRHPEYQSLAILDF